MKTQSNPGNTSMNKIKLSPALLTAVQAYFTHRDNQQSTVKWDKEGDLDAIFEQAHIDGFTRCEALVGTFWFRKDGLTYQFDDQNFTGDIEGTLPTRSDAYGSSQAMNALFCEPV